jgi:uncharacterized protein YecT (DUF1311 family)
MIGFGNTHGFFGTIVLLTLTAGCSSSQLSQRILSKISQKPSTCISLSSEPSQATLVTSTKPTTQARNCQNFNQCPELTASAAQQRLEEVYQQLVSQLGGASREKLINSQLKWVTFVEAQCSFETRGFDDSTQFSLVGDETKPTLRDRCLDSMAQQRTQDLTRYLN